jgi:hypothetical protein
MFYNEICKKLSNDVIGHFVPLVSNAAPLQVDTLLVECNGWFKLSLSSTFCIGTGTRVLVSV